MPWEALLHWDAGETIEVSSHVHLSEPGMETGPRSGQNKELCEVTGTCPWIRRMALEMMIAVEVW